jgi:hypothetical protein
MNSRRLISGFSPPTGAARRIIVRASNRPGRRFAASSTLPGEGADLSHGPLAAVMECPAGSLRLEARKLHHFTPFVGFFGDKLTELGGRTSERFAAYFGKLCSHPRIGQRGIDLAV